MSDLPELPSLDDVPVSSGSTLGGPGSLGGPAGSGVRPGASMAAGLAPSTSPFAGLDLRSLGRKFGRGAAWVAALFMVFLISAWVSLPTRSIAWRISHEARKAGVNLAVEDVSIRPWGSVTLTNVVWSFKPSRPDSTPVPFMIEELDASFSILKYLLFDTIDLEFEGAMDEGSIAGAFYKSDDESRIAFSIADLPLYGVPKLQDAVNAPVRGVFTLDVDMTAPSNEWSKSSGRLEVHCYACTIGDNETKLFVPGTKKTSMLAKGVTIPEIDLGTLDGVLEIVDGKAVAEEFGTESSDIVFKISGDIEFKDPIANSRLNLLIKVFIDPSLRERSDNVDLLVLTASPKVKMDPPDEGWMGIVLEGNLKHRRFRGVKSKTKAEALREKRDRRNSQLKDRQADRAKQKAERERKKAEAEAAKKLEPDAEPDSEPEEEEPEIEIAPEVGAVRELELAGSDEDAAGDEEGGDAGGEDEGGEDEGGGEEDEAAEETGQEQPPQ